MMTLVLLSSGTNVAVMVTYCYVVTINLDRLLDSIAFIDLLEYILLHVLLVMCLPFRLFDLDDSNRLYTDDVIRLI